MKKGKKSSRRKLRIIKGGEKARKYGSIRRGRNRLGLESSNGSE